MQLANTVIQNKYVIELLLNDTATPPAYAVRVSEFNKANSTLIPFNTLDNALNDKDNGYYAEINKLIHPIAKKLFLESLVGS